MTHPHDLAVVLGWQREEVPDWDGGTDTVWRCPYRCHPEHERGCWGHIRPSWSVDHLLHWCRQQQFASFHFGFQGDGFYVDWGDDAAHGHTLLATLEKAIASIAKVPT